jgi:hypothetical protein
MPRVTNMSAGGGENIATATRSTRRRKGTRNRTGRRSGAAGAGSGNAQQLPAGLHGLTAEQAYVQGHQDRCRLLGAPWKGFGRA